MRHSSASCSLESSLVRPDCSFLLMASRRFCLETASGGWRGVVKVKGKVVPVLCFATSALDGGEWSALRPGRFTPKERAPGIHWIGGWVGSRAVLDAVVKKKIPSSRRESTPGEV
jgi:hypothetical protein